MRATTLASAALPVKGGEIRIAVLRVGEGSSEQIALVKGEIAGAELVPTYLHCECLFGDRFGSLACGCRGLLERAIEGLCAATRAVFVYVSPDPSSFGALDGCANRPTAASRAIAAAVLQTLGARSAQLLSADGGASEIMTWSP